MATATEEARSVGDSQSGHVLGRAPRRGDSQSGHAPEHPMTARDLVDGIVDVRLRQGGEVLVSRVCIDSRLVRANDLFVAVPGAKEDGARYIADAVSRGATAILTPEGAAVPGACAWMTSSNPRRAAAHLAARLWQDPSATMPIFGITGTNGKTTTSFLLRAILESSGRPTAVIGTLGAWLPSGHVPHARTTPEAPELLETIAAAQAEGASCVAMEVSSHALDLYRVDGIAFEAAAFLNLTPEHLDWHKTMEAYGNSKTRLFRELLKAGRPVRGTRAIVNANDPWAARIRSEVGEVTTFGVDLGGTDITAHGVVSTSAGSRFELRTPEGSHAVELALPGIYNVENALAAAGLARALGLSPKEIAEGLSRASAPPGRFERVYAGSFDAFVDYAHTEDGLGLALGVAREVAKGRVFVVLGCGGERDKGKRPGMGRIASTLADVAFFTTDNPRSEDPAAIIREMMDGVASPQKVEVVPDRREALAAACALATRGDVVIACGKGHETYQSIAGVNHHFPEREILRDVARAADREGKGNS